MEAKKRIGLSIDYVESEYTLKIIRGASDYLKRRGYELLIFATGGRNSMEFSYDYQYLAVASHMTVQNLAGILFIASQALNYYSMEYVHAYIKSFAPLPVVSIGYNFADIPYAVVNSKKSMRQLVEHLITAHHCRRIALMSVAGDSVDAQEREQVFRDVIAEHGLPFDESMEIFGSFDYDTAVAALNEYRKQRGKLDFDAIVCLNDEMAYACLDALQYDGIRVPQDIIVTGFDDQARSAFGNPTLTTINQNIEGQAKAAAKMLCDMIEGRQTPKRCTTSARPVFRQSCGCVSLENGMYKELNAKGELVDTRRSSPDFDFSTLYVKRTQFVQVIRLYSDMQVDMTLEQFRWHINTDLSYLGITAAAVVLFENPIETDQFEYFQLPDKAVLFSAFDRQSGYILGKSAEPVHFNPRKVMVPDEVFASMDGMYVVSLYRSSVLFGYIMYRPGMYDVSVYSIVCKMLSSNLASAYALTRSETEKKRLEKEYDVVHNISVTDELTGLLNRRGFISIGQKTLEAAENVDQECMVLFSDIDGLKKINDTYGHKAGDIAIKTAAELLKKTFGSSDIVGRLGGDEFAIVAPGLTVPKLAVLRAKLSQACADWNRSSGQPFELSMSVGHVNFSTKGSSEKYTIKLLLEAADESLYREKKIKHAQQAAKERNQ